MNTTTGTATQQHNHLALEEAKDAITKLKSMIPFLSPSDEETLAILIDKELVKDLSSSVSEAEQGQYEPLEPILS